MAHLPGVVVAAVGAFIGTNIDDFVMLLLVVMALPRDGAQVYRLFAGQYIGFGALLVISEAGAMALSRVPAHWLGLLALVPLSLGIRGFVRARRAPPATRVPDRLGSVAAIATLTVANGADNVSVYVPFLRQLSLTGTAAAMLVFLLMLGGTCGAAYLIGRYAQFLIPRFIQAGRWLTPAVFVAIGVALLIRMGVFDVIAGLAWRSA